jgi:carboxypeptidase PM20D1
MVLGATDARHFEGLSDCIYRFAPNLINKDDFKRVHGIDERINANQYKRMIQFYYQLLKNTAGAIE